MVSALVISILDWENQIKWEKKKSHNNIYQRSKKKKMSRRRIRKNKENYNQNDKNHIK